MIFCFADDSQQLEPTRRDMRPVVGVGGVLVEATELGSIQREVDEVCRATGFPDGEEFKWSPGRELWMWKSLHGQERERFFLRLLSMLGEHRAEVVVVVVDRMANTASDAETPEADATCLFLERASNRFQVARSDGVVIVDRPSGDRTAENRFVAQCVDQIEDSSTYAVPENFALPVLTAQSRFVRLLQIADVITACTVAFVAGERHYAPPIFEGIKPLLACQAKRAGGVGLKIHPDFRYVNLYHWLLGDADFYKGMTGYPLPLTGRLYATDDGIP